ncbi:mechanosensitive ion channel protein MscS [Cupriavidus basilensis]|uniref:Mechanosensitive ion channel protein MscS n=1 Tax=Cupriavidus basilensis TaxID=68895 RepID=A0A643FWT4_9BURK|nr:mechanosensitive ion channel protein MscS [Cupriavidus basilensis]QOT78817.1 mechanosensitive ion channel protein MscS [Cupriavidus basilensis]
MRNTHRAIRVVGVGLVAAALLAAGPASARDRYQGSYHGGGSAGAVALAIGALVGLAVIGTAVASQPVVVAAPPQPAYGPPPGYCYRDYDHAYVPCAPQPAPYYYQQPPQPQYQGYQGYQGY